jgi:peptide chain release factor-like protein
MTALNCIATDLPHAEIHPAELDNDTLRSQCDVRTTRRSGPGGQHRNKAETAVVITHRPTGIRAEANERRSQHENAVVAWRRLRVQLATKIRSKRQTADVPSPIWSRRMKGGISKVNPDNADFPALLALALDTIHATALRMPEAARALQVTASQLTRLVALAPAALAELNRLRKERGLRALQM